MVFFADFVSHICVNFVCSLLGKLFSMGALGLHFLCPLSTNSMVVVSSWATNLFAQNILARIHINMYLFLVHSLTSEVIIMY